MLKEIHLHLDVRQPSLSKYWIIDYYVNTKKEINGALNNQEEIYEITLEKCKGMNREIKKGYNLEKCFLVESLIVINNK